MAALKLLVLFLVSALSVDLKSTLKRELNRTLMLLDDNQVSMNMKSTWKKESNETLNESLMLLSDNQLIKIFSPRDVIPYQFWTSSNARGEERGQGVAPGHEFVVFKSIHGKFLSLGDWAGNNPSNDRTHCGRWEKFEVELVGDNQIAIKGWNGKWMSCRRNGNLQINRPRVGGWEKFHVYTTSNCDRRGLAIGDDCLALKSVRWRKFVVAESNGDVNCNRDRPGSFEKWFGWTDPIPWNVYSIEFDLNRGRTAAMTPENLGEIRCNNINGSIERDCSRTEAATVAQTETYENNAEVSITMGTTFSAGVPFVADGEISTELSASYGHTWGTETYDEKEYRQNIECVSPPGILTVCKYVATKARMDVPYTMHLTKPGGFHQSTAGIWHGISTFDAHIEFREFP